MGPDENKDHLLELGVTGKDGFDYYTSLYVGSAQEEVKLAVDTLSLATVLASQNCEGCRRSGGNRGFAYQDSTTIRKMASQTVEYNLEGAVAKGLWVRDDVWLTPGGDDQLREFPFLLANEWP